MIRPIPDWFTERIIDLFEEWFDDSNGTLTENGSENKTIEQPEIVQIVSDILTTTDKTDKIEAEQPHVEQSIKQTARPQRLI
jgi:hypothetical protein